MPATADPRARELALSIERDGSDMFSTLTASVVFKATAADVAYPEHIGCTLEPRFTDYGHNSAAVYDGLRITATYDGRHFYDAVCAYDLEGPVFEAQAAAMANTLRVINDALVKQRHDPDGTDLGRHDYPGLVLAVGKILGVSFAAYQLDVDPDSRRDWYRADLADLGRAFDMYTPRDKATEPRQR